VGHGGDLFSINTKRSNMKKIIPLCLAGTLLSFVTVGATHGQLSSRISDSLFRNEVNIKAVQHFMKTYKAAANVRWRKTDKGYRVYFTADDIQFRIFYSKKGLPVSVIRYYGEDKLPRDVRHLVKSHYYDYSIVSVAEVNHRGMMAYMVKMKNNSSWKTVKVSNNEMEVTEEFKKAD
jgi:hypothetical protein